MKQNEFFKREFCPLCGSKAFYRYLNTTDFFLSGKEFGLEKCNDCGLVFTNPIIEEAYIGNYYDSDQYFSHPNQKRSPLKLLYDLIKKHNIKSKFKQINRYKQSGTLLDIGCGSGDFIKYGKDNGWEVSGIEPNEKARDFAAGLTGEKILKPEQADELPLAHFDVITMWHVLEHVEDLDKQLNLINRLASRFAVLFIALPNYRAYDAIKYGKYWAAWDVPRHLYHFDKNTIQQLFLKYNFELKVTYPMIWDAFYVSLLSEKYMKRSFPMIRAVVTGMKSNQRAKNENNYSSLVYCFERKLT